MKKCIICSAEATYKIRDTADYYCDECAADNFSDVSFLEKVADAAQKLKNIVDEKRGEE